MNPLEDVFVRMEKNDRQTNQFTYKIFELDFPSWFDSVAQ